MRSCRSINQKQLLSLGQSCSRASRTRTNNASSGSSSRNSLRPLTASGRGCRASRSRCQPRRTRESRHHCLGDRASGRLRYESTTGEIWRDRGRGKALHAGCGDRRRQSAKTQERTFQTIPRKVRPHACFGRGRNSLGKQAAPCRNRRPWRALPVMDEVLAEAKRRGIEVIAAPTVEVCQLLEEVKKGQAHAILHCTC